MATAHDTAIEMDVDAKTQKQTSLHDKEVPGTGNGTVEVIDEKAERAYVRKLDAYLLPFLSLMYFFNSVDRSNLGNAQTDNMDKDLGFRGEEYSLLVLLFYVPNGLCDLPLNLLTVRLKGGGRVVLSGLMLAWGSCALLQCAATNFAGLLVLRLLLGGFEAGFFAGVVFYLTLFYTRGELGFRLALFFGSALLAGAFSGLISYGVFRIEHAGVPGWKWLFLIEGAMTVIIAVAAYFWLPTSASTAWFLDASEREVAERRTLRDLSSTSESTFNWAECFRTWSDWKFIPWCVIAFTYPVAFTTTSNFLPQIVQRLGYSVVKTNLWTVAPNAVGFVVLLAVAWSSDRLRERCFHIVFALTLSLIGLLLLATIDVVENKGLAYFACFLLTCGAYIPSCLVHSWHNNNNLNENSRAATTGLLVGLGNLGGIVSAATFRSEYAPKYVPNLVATAVCNATCIVVTLALGVWMKLENRRRDKVMGRKVRPEEVSTAVLGLGEESEMWRYFT
ncbi:MFS general substrate transporter [Massarina eburnea CBS 473.64]|uniref:MFS general substrate transporter n=1 Tax=Massarina eburnea CBS 473.64 TaxID=1395130 RepID=A0A6A6RPS6_9PLEO|nr:MFS general substrate transporter [Massarina eburnea CBS 473.64]